MKKLLSLVGCHRPGCRMTKIRTLVVDDEPVARSHVMSLLLSEPDIEVVGECSNGLEAIAAIEQASPQLLFQIGRAHV